MSVYGYDKKSSASVTTLILNHKQLKVQPVDDLKMISNPAYSNVAATTEDQDQPIYEPVDPVDEGYRLPNQSSALPTAKPRGQQMECMLNWKLVLALVYPRNSFTPKHQVGYHFIIVNFVCW